MWIFLDVKFFFNVNLQGAISFTSYVNILGNYEEILILFLAYFRCLCIHMLYQIILYLTINEPCYLPM